MEITPRFVYLLKNLRGIIYFSRNVDISEELKWLKRKFRYRLLAILKDLATNFNVWENVVLVNFPFKGVRSAVIKTVMTASLFAVPVIVLRERSARDFDELTVLRLKTGELGEREIKRNIRLVNYAITDFYVQSIEYAKKCDIASRRKIVERDVRRYWRLKEGETVHIFYVDVLYTKKKKNWKSIPMTCFSLVPCVVIDRKLFKQTKLRNG